MNWSALVRRPGVGAAASAFAGGRPGAGGHPDGSGVLTLKLATDAPAPAPSNPYLPATTALRDVAKWLIGALAAVAAVMLAGTQLSSLGALSAQHPGRLVTAVVAAAVVVAAISGAIYLLTTVLPMDFSGMHGLVEASREQPMRAVLAADSGYCGGRTSVSHLLDDYETARKAERLAYRTRAALAREEAEHPDPTKDLSAQLTCATKREALATAEVNELKKNVTLLIQMKGYLAVQRRFERARTGVIWLALVAAVGIIAFAWAAKPADATGPSPALNPSPVSARLVLTQAGVSELGAVIGPRCAAAAGTDGVPVVVLDADAAGAELVVLGQGVCTTVTRVTVEKRLGRPVPTDEPDLPARATG